MSSSILAASERAANLTGSLLAFSRKQEIELQPVDLNDVIFSIPQDPGAAHRRGHRPQP